jgi:hypothetical protein
MKKLFLFALLLVPPVALAQTIYQKEDKFSGQTHYFTDLRDVDLEGGSFFTMRNVYFDFHAFKPAIDSAYYLSARTETPDWVFISSGKSLLLKLDGKKIPAQWYWL